MTVTISGEGDKTLVKIEGRIDTTNAKEFETQIQSLLTGEQPNIEMDCREFTYISSSGLRVFLLLQKSVNARKGTLVIKELCPEIKEVFTITGFVSIFNIE